MLLGFKRQFAGFVEDGSKTHTIRAVRKIRPHVGEACHCYVDPRQKSMRLLGRWPCVKIEEVRIYEGSRGFGISIEGVTLNFDERNALAWRDGFREGGEDGAFDSMMRFWMTTHGNARRLELFHFIGHIIHWDYAHPLRPLLSPVRRRAA